MSLQDVAPQPQPSMARACTDGSTGLSYGTALGVCDSDHRPVWCSLQVLLPAYEQLRKRRVGEKVGGGRGQGGGAGAGGRCRGSGDGGVLTGAGSWGVRGGVCLGVPACNGCGWGGRWAECVGCVGM